MTATLPLDTFVEAQISALVIDGGRPLIITDADEVLFQFMARLEEFIRQRNLIFDWSSFALTGNIRDAATNEPAAPAEVKKLLAAFFAEQTADLDPVDGAAAALRRLSGSAQIVVLSNVPQAAVADRIACLRRHGMDFPLIANVGAKGPAVRALMGDAVRPAVFIDDIPHNHKSVAQAAPDILRLHFVAHPRLAALIGPAEYADQRLHSWPEIEAAIVAHFGELGA
jgi:hypothetical protein